MSNRAVDLSDEELTTIFRAAAKNAALEAAQCGLSVVGSVKLPKEGHPDEIRAAVRLPSGEIELARQRPALVKRRRAKAA